MSLHDVTGKLKWIRQFGSVTGGEDVATGVAGNGAGAYVTGYTAGTLAKQANAGGVDSFVRFYDPDGAEVWTHQFGATSDDYAYGVATHTSGVYVVGQVECCGSSLPGQLPTAATDAYVTKFSEDGKSLWTKMISTGNTERASGVAVDDSGVYVAGTTNGDLAGSAGGIDGYVRKYSHGGEVLWTRQFGTLLANGGTANDDVFAIAAWPGGVYVTGATAQGAVPGGAFAGGLWDGFVLRMDAGDGTVQWNRQIGSDGDDYAYGVAVGEGHLLVAGGTSASLVGGAFVGGEDAFLRLYDFAGNVIGTRQFGGGLNDRGAGVVAFPGGFFVGGMKNGGALGLAPIGPNTTVIKTPVPPRKPHR